LGAGVLGLLFAAVIDGKVQSTNAPMGSLAERILLLAPGAVLLYTAKME
jgi:hypothetical protein